MSTKRKPWPTAAGEQRNQAAEAAVRGIRALRPLIRGDVQLSRTETLRREAQALNELQQIALLLYAAGAPIRPEDF